MFNKQRQRSNTSAPIPSPLNAGNDSPKSPSSTRIGRRPLERANSVNEFVPLKTKIQASPEDNGSQSPAIKIGGVPPAIQKVKSHAYFLKAGSDLFNPTTSIITVNTDPSDPKFIPERPKESKPQEHSQYEYIIKYLNMVSYVAVIDCSRIKTLLEQDNPGNAGLEEIRKFLGDIINKNLGNLIPPTLAIQSKSLVGLQQVFNLKDVEELLQKVIKRREYRDSFIDYFQYLESYFKRLPIGSGPPPSVQSQSQQIAKLFTKQDRNPEEQQLIVDFLKGAIGNNTGIPKGLRDEAKQLISGPCTILEMGVFLEKVIEYTPEQSKESVDNGAYDLPPSIRGGIISTKSIRKKASIPDSNAPSNSSKSDKEDRLSSGGDPMISLQRGVLVKYFSLIEKYVPLEKQNKFQIMYSAIKEPTCDDFNIAIAARFAYTTFVKLGATALSYQDLLPKPQLDSYKYDLTHIMQLVVKVNDRASLAK